MKIVQIKSRYTESSRNPALNEMRILIQKYFYGQMKYWV